MQADWSVELGRDDESLEFPWRDPDGRVRYYDLKRHPETLAEITEAQSLPGLSDFLRSVNLPSGALESAKCDAWISTEMTPEDEEFGAACKCASYVDLLFVDPASRFSFAACEALARKAAQLLKAAPEIPAAAEFIVRRCWFGDEQRDGFYITFYLFGYGADEERARRQWTIGMELAANALRQATVRVT